MPYKDKAKRAEAVRRHRAKRRAAAAPVPAVIPPFPSDPSGELARWSRDVLKVPVGHPRAGEPMILPGVSIKLETEVSFDLQALWAHDPAGRAAAFSKLVQTRPMHRWSCQIHLRAGTALRQIRV